MGVLLKKEELAERTRDRVLTVSAQPQRGTPEKPCGVLGRAMPACGGRPPVGSLQAKPGRRARMGQAGVWPLGAGRAGGLGSLRSAPPALAVPDSPTGEQEGRRGDAGSASRFCVTAPPPPPGAGKACPDTDSQVPVRSPLDSQELRAKASPRACPSPTPNGTSGPG